MLAGIFYRDGYVSTEPEAATRLVVYPEKQWLRVVAHHCDGPGREMGGSADTYPPHGRNRGTRTGRALEI